MCSQFNPLCIYFTVTYLQIVTNLIYLLTTKSVLSYQSAPSREKLYDRNKTQPTKIWTRKNHTIVTYRDVSVHFTSLARNMCFGRLEILRIKTACSLTHAFFTSNSTRISSWRRIPGAFVLWQFRRELLIILDRCIFLKHVDSSNGLVT